MPIYEIACNDCGVKGEVLVVESDAKLTCPDCGSANTTKLMSATSSMTGQANSKMPGPGDTACCGRQPGAGSCAGPGSCCGRS
ncbi:MAG: zinc ribbon domain-containing protein [Deltaproteobacteria bacterium]|nr:MAG: zinc ribbon domain-containing protein [Deltaproteobacteria bacterium]RUA01381.1 MAG: zinc ribbon domain-containing protein [Deltaproteobacteria bacterium]